jgi:N6-adenosine-specific RNA methylase IME4
MTYEFHPIASIFPIMDGEEFDGLVSDIREHGLREPITLFEGKVLDGRNRYLACEKIGLEPKTKTFTGTFLEAIEYVWSLNRARRHLNSSQAAIANAKREKMFQAYQVVREDAEKRQQEAGARGKEGGRGKKKTPTQQIAEGFPSRTERETRTVRAKTSGTNRTYIDLADKLLAEHPDVAEQVEKGKKTLTQVQREMREEKREQRRQENQEKATACPDPLVVGAKFATILIDPPWDWGDEGDVNQLGRAKPDYATMSKEQLLSLPVAALADVDCHLYCWITNRSLPKGFDLLEAWGFRYVTMLTWPKPRLGMGNYFRGQTEHVLFGVKGSQGLKRKDASTLLPTWKRGERHSSKPVEFYEFVESCSPGPYLELFGRSERDHWHIWGADASAQKLQL